jgi:hypothetical protein
MQPPIGMNVDQFSIFEPVRQHVDHRLRVRLRVFLIVWLILASIIAVNVLRQNLNMGLAFAGFLTGFLTGLFLSRMYRLDWSEETTKVVSQLDLIGRIILAAYVLFMVGRDWIFGHWVQASDLMGLIMCFTAGTMIGRVGATRRGIRLVLHALGSIELQDPDSKQINSD